MKAPSFKKLIKISEIFISHLETNDTVTAKIETSFNDNVFLFRVDNLDAEFETNLKNDLRTQGFSVELQTIDIDSTVFKILI